MTMRHFLDDLGQTILPFFSKAGVSLGLSKGILPTGITHFVRFQVSSSMNFRNCKGKVSAVAALVLKVPL
jgi:hypothetical protein